MKKKTETWITGTTQFPKCIKSKIRKNTASIDRNGNLSIIGSSNFYGKLTKLRKIIDDVINEYGDDTKCRMGTFNTKGYDGSHIIITNKEIK